MYVDFSSPPPPPPPRTLPAYCCTLSLHAVIKWKQKKRKEKEKCFFPPRKISEHREAAENTETQFMVHDIHEKQADLESQLGSEQSIQCEKEHLCQGYHLNSPRRVEEVVQHFKMSSMNKCHNSQGKSDTNVKDNADKSVGVSSEESECNEEKRGKKYKYSQI